jgi:hypothetical protein
LIIQANRKNAANKIEDVRGENIVLNLVTGHNFSSMDHGKILDIQLNFFMKSAFN